MHTNLDKLLLLLNLTSFKVLCSRMDVLKSNRDSYRFEVMDIVTLICI